MSLMVTGAQKFSIYVLVIEWHMGQFIFAEKAVAEEPDDFMLPPF